MRRLPLRTTEAQRVVARRRPARVRHVDVDLTQRLLDGVHDAADGVRMGTVNRAVPHAELEATGLEWGRLVNGKSPTAQRMLKYSFNLIDDGLVGQQLFAGETTRLAYMTDEAQEGRDQFLEKREPDWSPYPWYY